MRRIAVAALACALYGCAQADRRQDWTIELSFQVEQHEAPGLVATSAVKLVRTLNRPPEKELAR